MRRGMKRGAAAVALALMVSACGSGGESAKTDVAPVEGVSARADGAEILERNEPVQGGTLSIAQDSPVESLDPSSFDGSTPEAIVKAITGELVRLDANGAVVPSLAESLESADGGKTWVLLLRKGVTFSDGTPLDAAAVKAHWTRIGAEGSVARQASTVRTITSMEETDPTTLTITLAAATPSFAKALTAMPAQMNTIGSPAAFKEAGKDIAFAPVGAGPFELVEFKAGGDVVLERNDDYHVEGLPHLDGLRFVAATDTQARLSATLAGDIDLALSQVGADVQKAAESGLAVMDQPSSSGYNIQVNLSKPPFDDERFRQAVTMALDNDALNSAAFGGLHVPFDGMFTSDHPFHAAGVWPEFDPEAARALVEEWAADTGQEPAFELVTTSPPEFQKLAAVAQQMLSDVGIDMQISVGDQPTMISQSASGDFQAQLKAFVIYPETDQQLFLFYHSESTANRGRGSDPEMDTIIDELQAATDLEERKTLAEQAQTRLAEWVPMMPLVQRPVVWVAGDKVGGFPGAVPGTSWPDLAEVYIAE